ILETLFFDLNRVKNNFMKVLHISTNDIQGGASRGSYSLHRGLLKSGIESLMLVATKTSDDFTVVGQNTKIQKVFNHIITSIWIFK
ncbi:MAG: hypothetical protein ACKPEQ_34475, partial [Dolichospermum sp.]